MPGPHGTGPSPSAKPTRRRGTTRVMEAQRRMDFGPHDRACIVTGALAASGSSASITTRSRAPGTFWAWLENLSTSTLGFIIVGPWMRAIAVWRSGRIDDRWKSSLDTKGRRLAHRDRLPVRAPDPFLCGSRIDHPVRVLISSCSPGREATARAPQSPSRMNSREFHVLSIVADGRIARRQPHVTAPTCARPPPRTRHW